MSSSQKIYLDYAATTPVDPRVLRAMAPYFTEKFGNAGSLHSFGQEAIAAVDKSRETIANAIGAEFREIIFTGSATEANNLALRGIIKRFKNYDFRLRKSFGGQVRFKNRKLINPKSKIIHPRIIISAIEHESVLETARDLEKDGVEVVVLPVDRHGVVDLKKLKSSLNNRTVLVSIMYANNEIGTIQPIAEISKIISEFRTGKTYPLFHTDAVQAFQFLDCNVNDLGIDLMTLSAHKIYGPKGIGALYARDMRHETRDKKQEARNGLRENKSLSLVACRLSPLTTGGGQEFGLRSGTENVPSIVGFAKAVELALAAREKEGKRIAALRDYFLRGITKIYPKAKLNGAPQNELPITNYQLPNILNMFSPGIAAQDLLTRLDLAGVAASAGSACAARSFTPSATLQALGYSADRAKQSVRFSFGRPTTKAEIDKALSAIKIILHNH